MIGIEDRKQELRETYQSKEYRKNNTHDQPITRSNRESMYNSGANGGGN